MIPAILLVCAVAAAWCGLAVYNCIRIGTGFRQALLLVPVQLFARLDTGEIRIAREAAAPVIYVVLHRSRVEPAAMLSLLPEGTLHILDEYSARALWMEPWRELARTIPFNARHVFVSRRLVRVLKGKGRLAVYIPDEVEPDAKAFRLLRAVGRIATAANASIVPILIERGTDERRIRALPAMTMAALIGQIFDGRARPSSALLDRIAELRMREGDPKAGLFQALVTASRQGGENTPILRDGDADPITYRRLLTRIRALAPKLERLSAPGDAVGLLLPTSGAFVEVFFGLQSAGRVAVPLNHTAGPAALSSAIGTTMCRRVVASHRFVDEAGLDEHVAAIEKAGARIVWLEELSNDISAWDRLSAALMRNRPLQRQDGDRPAVILFTSGAEGPPKGVVLSGANIVSNCLQLRARMAFSGQDRALNALPVFHALGLTGGTLLPLLSGVQLVLYPSPLDVRAIAELAAKVKPTIMFGTDTLLNTYARAADENEFASLRLVVAGAEPVRAVTRLLWRERYGLEIREGYAATEASPVVSLNTLTHGRDATVGRPLPAVRIRVQPVEGLSGEAEGLLSVSGPNVMLGYMSEERPGQIAPPENGWHDTGDIVAVDREGFIALRGRARRFAKVGGEMVSLAAIEQLAQALEPEAGHVAIALPDQRKGERIVLATTSGLSRDVLRREGRKRGLPEIAAADQVVAVEEIPMLGAGKVDFARVRQMAIEKLGLDAAA